MYGWSHVLAQQARYDDFLRQAQAHRLACETRRTASRTVATIRRVLAWLGRQLVAWGWRLQRRRLAPYVPTECCGAIQAPLRR